MRSLSFLVGLSGLLVAGALAAQPLPEPPAGAPPPGDPPVVEALPAVAPPAEVPPAEASPPAESASEPPLDTAAPVPPPPAEADTNPPSNVPPAAEAPPASDVAAEAPVAPAAVSAPPAPPVSTAPPAQIDQQNVWHLDLSTGGRVSILLRPDAAPAHVERIRTLTRQGFYNGLTFHRVIDGFMAQGGDPTGTGAGGSALPDLPAEIRGLPHVRGAVGMARAEDLNSANSQFYIMFVPRLTMDRNYTVVGRVIAGMNFVDTIERGEPPMQPSRIVRASIGADNVATMSAEELRAAAAQLAPPPVQDISSLSRSAAAGPPVPPPPAAPRELEPVRGPQRGRPPR